ncbi:heparinase II/III domain-containing protein [Puniceicoccus vermicola]|uniref:heparinase II/III domain-containing protein n=1 Tax=Puniceicoccus vermicola TaxID=388746 RepID=UPI003397EA4C
MRGQDIASALQTIDLSHPRLLWSAEGVEDMKVLIEEDPQVSGFADHVYETADNLCEEPVLERVMEGRRLLDVSREFLRRILYWGVSYRLTGDERYAERAREEMLEVCGFTDWNPSHFLDVAEMTAGMAIGYDWFFETLSEEDRKAIREGIISQGLEPSYEIDGWWVDYPNNWNQVIHGGLVMGALAIYDQGGPEIAVEVIERALENAHSGLSTYGPDGAYPEGPAYWSYGTSYSVLMMASLESVFGSDFGLSEAPGFLESAEYVLHSGGPSGQYFNYSDSRPQTGIRPEVFWFAEKLGRPELLWRQRKNLAKFNANELAEPPDTRMFPLLLVWGNGLSEEIVPEDLDWSGGGETPVAFHRTSWTDPDATYVGIKGGAPSVSHAHMDVGQFVMESDGVRWASDLGMQSYHELEATGLHIFGKDRWKVFRMSNMSHSVLVVNGQPQGFEGSATIERSATGEEGAYTILDMSEVYAGQLKGVRRGIALKKNGAVQVEDDFEILDQPTEIRWSMLTFAEVTLEDDHRATLTQDGETLSFEVLSPKAEKLEVIDISNPPKDYDARNPGAKLLSFTLSLEPSADEHEQRIAVALIPGSLGDIDPEFLPMQDWSSSGAVLPLE